MKEFWQDPQDFYDVDKHFTCFEDAETLCMWVGQLPDEEISRLAGRFFGCKELGGQSLKKCGKVSNRHVTEACMLAEVLPVFRRTLLFSSQEALQSLSSEKAAVAACDFIMQLIRARVLPGALVAEMLTVVAVWPACVLIVAPSLHSRQECDAPLQRTQTVQARMPEGTPSPIQSQDFFRTQSKLTRSDGLFRTQSEPTRTSCARAEGLFRTQTDPGSKSYTTAKTSLRPHESHVQFAKEVVVRVERFETNEIFEVDVNLHETEKKRWSHRVTCENAISRTVVRR
jgi:hypothetical protein